MRGEGDKEIADGRKEGRGQSHKWIKCCPLCSEEDNRKQKSNR